MPTREILEGYIAKQEKIVQAQREEIDRRLANPDMYPNCDDQISACEKRIKRAKDEIRDYLNRIDEMTREERLARSRALKEAKAREDEAAQLRFEEERKRKQELRKQNQRRDGAPLGEK